MELFTSLLLRITVANCSISSTANSAIKFLNGYFRAQQFLFLEFTAKQNFSFIIILCDRSKISPSSFSFVTVNLYLLVYLFYFFADIVELLDSIQESL